MSDQENCPKCGRAPTANWTSLDAPTGLNRWRCVCGEVFTSLDVLRAQLAQEREKNETLRSALAELLAEWKAWNPRLTGTARTRAERVLAEWAAEQAAATDKSAEASQAEGDSHE